MIVVAMEQLRSQLAMVLKGGRVRRFHTKFMIHDEKVAEHHHVVLWVAALYWRGVYGQDPSAKLLLACASHDLPEHVTGDIPSPAKRRVPAFREEMERYEGELFDLAVFPRYCEMLTPEEAELLSFADNFAGWMKCLYEAALGNTTLATTQTRYREYLETLLKESKYIASGYCSALVHSIQQQGVPL